MGGDFLAVALTFRDVAINNPNIDSSTKDVFERQNQNCFGGD